MQEAKRQQQQPAAPMRPDSRASDFATGQALKHHIAAAEMANLSAEEVIYRLRVLGEPVTLFGETDEQRQQRMLVAEQNIQVRR